MVDVARRVRDTRGKSSRGCLVTLLVFTAVAYFGVGIGAQQVRYTRMRDYMKAQARFAVNLDDDLIRRRIRGKAEELGLPASARRISIRRRGRPREIVIRTTWPDTLVFPFYQKIIERKPEVHERL